MNLRWIEIVTFSLLLGLLSCEKKERANEVVESLPKTDRFEGLRKNLIGQEIRFLDSIPGLVDNINDGGILFYYSGFDCGTCVSKGVASVKELKRRGFQVKILSFQANISQDQSYYDYNDRIWVDQEDFLHDDFTFIPTPFFLVFDQKRQVIDLHFPLNTQNPDSLRFFPKLYQEH